MRKSALVIGATGATGTALLAQLLDNDNYGEVHIFVRRSGAQKSKLQAHVVNLMPLMTGRKTQRRRAICGHGNNLKNCWKQKKRHKIDYTYQFEVAKAAAENEVSTLLLVSSTGSSSKSPFFYPKIKGQLEDAVSQLNFKQVHIFQPPMLDRGSFLRSNEKSGIKFLNIVNKLGILRSQMPMPVDFLAKQMIRVANRDSDTKVKKYNPTQIWKL